MNLYMCTVHDAISDFVFSGTILYPSTKILTGCMGIRLPMHTTINNTHMNTHTHTHIHLHAHTYLHAHTHTHRNLHQYTESNTYPNHSFIHVVSWTWKSGHTSSGPRALAMRPWTSDTHMYLCSAERWSYWINMCTARSVLFALRAPARSIN